MARAASTTPLPSWVRFCSTNRAKYGMALIVSGTITAAVPMVVPTTNRVNGMMAIKQDQERERTHGVHQPVDDPVGARARTQAVR